MPKATIPQGIVRATTSFIASVGGEDVPVKVGDLADADSAIVRKHPGLFEPVTVRFAGPRVEAATAAPGEKRGA
jgi:hypothetical protein